LTDPSGAGSAGASAAYYLSLYASQHLSPTPPLNITIFERNPYIGGRSTTVDVFGNTSQPVELGASIFVSVNQNLVNAVNTFGLSVADDEDDEDEATRESLGIWDGDKFVYTQPLGGSRLMSWWTTAKLFYRYGVLEPYRTRNLMRSTLARFLDIYTPPFFPFRSLQDVITATGLADAAALSGSDYLKTAGVQGLFAKELVQASTRVNYAQDLSYIHGVEAMVCMATDGAMSVKGGNWRIFDGMIRASGAALKLETSVERIERTDEGRYVVTTKDASSRSGPVSTSQDSPLGHLLPPAQSDTFDAVIIAAPIYTTHMSITPRPQHVPSAPNYVNLHVTLFSTPHRIRPEYFNLSSDARTPDMILTTPSGDSQTADTKVNEGLNALKFFSLSQVCTAINPVTGKRERVFKIFSKEKITGAQLRALVLPDSRSPVPLDDQDIEGISWRYHKLWQSYPYLPPRREFDPIKLDGDGEKVDEGEVEVKNEDEDEDEAGVVPVGDTGRGIWYTSGMESFISSMETSSLSGMNVARLIVDELVRGREKEREKEQEKEIGEVW